MFLGLTSKHCLENERESLTGCRVYVRDARLTARSAVLLARFMYSSRATND